MRISRLISGLFFGFVFSACGCLIAFFFGQDGFLTCTRVESSQVQCLQETKWLGIVPLGEKEIQNLTGARVVENCDDDGCTYRVELDTDQGRVALTSYYSSGEKAKREIADQINTFIQNPRSDGPLNVKSSIGPWGFILPLIFILVGPLVALSGLWRAIRGRY